ncbi:hypothetical protein TSOC_001011 [Tetrabaena socialis]|uniref:Uncharacterized protein n=1 Tax=Tetrabaena socialis TaxID=47790 RepID=A0A2J8AHW8_9CHLO|nr:hypothetical protein TSOC_001011 [Tetrabaena socialis]|eukprot:PNH12107.1 hypothetical protein TSOC_001011 [Tetrabaena socialis]
MTSRASSFCRRMNSLYSRPPRWPSAPPTAAAAAPPAPCCSAPLLLHGISWSVPRSCWSRHAPGPASLAIPPAAAAAAAAAAGPPAPPVPASTSVAPQSAAPAGTDIGIATGRGIFSQYNPDAAKEWVEREQKIPRRMPSSDKTLTQLRALQQTLPTPDGFRTTEPRPTSSNVQQPLSTPTLPQYAHHHHFGWLPPTPERRIAASPPVVSSRHGGHAYSYGLAQAHNEKIHNTHMAITTRKP